MTTEVLTDNTTIGDVVLRRCYECDELLSSARLKAIPTATLCVDCKEATGDDLRIRRYDDHNLEGTVVEETYFTKNPYIESVVEKLTKSSYSYLNTTKDGDYVGGHKQSNYVPRLDTHSRLT